MLLELITGRRPVDSTYSFMDDSLVDWVSDLQKMHLVLTCVFHFSFCLLEFSAELKKIYK